MEKGPSILEVQRVLAWRWRRRTQGDSHSHSQRLTLSLQKKLVYSDSLCTNYAEENCSHLSSGPQTVLHISGEQSLGGI